MGEPIRVSQALSLVMILVSAAMLFYQIRIRHASRADLMVNRLAAEAASAESAGETETAESADVSADAGEAEPSAEDDTQPAPAPEGDTQPETEAADTETEAPQSPSES